MSQAELVTDMPDVRSERTLPRSLVVLIEVPELKSRAIDRARRIPTPRVRTMGRQVARPRRRLRREVRLASCALMALVPIVSACTLGWSNRPDRIVACSISDPLLLGSDRDDFAISPRAGRGTDRAQPATTSAGVVLLSIEPAIVVPGAAPEAAVIFPGYVLPDDSREDSLHEGS
jgi:hypothetical protein